MRATAYRHVSVSLLTPELPLIPSIAARSESALWTVDPSAVTEDVGEPIVLCPDAWFSLERLQEAHHRKPATEEHSLRGRPFERRERLAR